MGLKQDHEDVLVAAVAENKGKNKQTKISKDLY